MVKYVVRFIYYQYNSGRGDNGHYALDEEFETLELARDFKRVGINNYENYEFLYRNHHIDGYLVRFDGIYKKEITRIE